ncbi:TonB-dependent receptor [Sphingorhabdus sp. EL138]|uniref:TonB-dependent receptor n=1 Tax=Sphingorhabdus sp. EL138 TaxID=2073156 RepID=UPI000D68AB56|nr:TonB-dependent receptor [Sphingorhabdus sp. EL138]
MKNILYTTVSSIGLLLATPALAQDNQDDGANDDNVIIVTAQRQSQSLQEVPVAVSAFDSKALESQQIENASDLQLTLPNVTFTKSQFTASSFTIRGIGDLCVGVSCDSATAIHLNSAPLFSTRLFETEYFDLERVEVLRGPQGTLFGRNATSGVVNVVTAKPNLGEFGASIDAEYGNFNSTKVKGMVNVPLGDSVGVRLAGFYLNRDGFTQNIFNNTDIDGRDMYAVRGSIRFEPGPDTTIDLMGYYFREDDDRLRSQKQTCQFDPTGVLGCLNGRRDFSNINTNSGFTGTLSSAEFLAFQLRGTPLAALAPSLALGSLYDGQGSLFNSVEPQNVRQVNTAYTPEYFTDELQIQAHIDHNFGAVQASLTGTYQETEVNSTQDYNLGIQDRSRFVTALNTISAVPLFQPVANAVIPNGPNGPICTSTTDPTGFGSYGGNRVCNDVPLSFDRSSSKTKSWSVEGILSSDLDGPFNFLLGGIYAEHEVTDNNYYVNTFAIDYISGLLGAGNGGFLATPFFRSNTPNFKLKSYGIFGEVYFDLTDTLKITGGLRYNNDKKNLTARSTLANFPVPFGFNGASVFDAPAAATYDADAALAGVQPFQVRTVGFDEITGRVVVDWQFSPDNLLYASYSRGYKSGGINPPVQPIFAVPDTFASESIDAFEIGSKNTFADGKLQLNATAFYYKYKDLQLSRIVARTSINDNIDADVYGIELEAVVRPDPDWLINMGFSWLKTKVTGDNLLANPRDPGAGDPNAVIIKDIGNASNCAVTGNNGADANAFVGAINGALGFRGPTPFPSDGGIASTGAFSFCGILQAAAAGNIGAASAALAPLQPLLDALGTFTLHGAGVETNVRGNALPQAPTTKFSIGVQHTVNFDNAMTLVPRVDVAYTGESFGNIFNGQLNRIKGFTQVNASIQLNSADENWYVKGFIQNVFDSNSVTGIYTVGAASGLFNNIFTLDPRRYGISAGIKF